MKGIVVAIYVLKQYLLLFPVPLPLFNFYMRLAVVFLFFGIFAPFTTFSAIWPKEGDSVHYRIIGFTFPAEKNATEYSIEIANGNFSDVSIFEKNIQQRINGKSSTITGEVPFWDREYTWRVVYLQKSKKVTPGPLYHFSTGITSWVDTNITRLRITRSTELYNDGYFFLDGARAMFDMNGRAVWYLGDMGGLLRTTATVRDMKMTPQGTITFLTESDAYEIDYNENLLWKGPDGRKNNNDTLEGYHHELVRLNNGHYMVMGYEPVVISQAELQRLSKNDTAALRASVRKRKNRYDNILEYDEAGKVVWSWSASKYFDHQNLDVYQNAGAMNGNDLHGNSFYFDEKRKFIYVSFRNIGQILKIQYPGGEVVQAYGQLTEDQSPPHTLFCGQHSCKQSSDGFLYLFNNGCSINKAPSVVMLKESADMKNTLEKIWEFPCPVTIFEKTSPAIANRKFLYTTGGGVTEIPGSAIFVTTCSPYSNLFIVSRDKKILWSCDAERWHNGRKTWSPLMQYRSAYVDRASLEKLVGSAKQ